MAANQTDCSMQEQRSVNKFLLAEKWEPSEIYRIHDVNREACFSLKNVYKWTKHRLEITSQKIKKKQAMERKYTSKENHADGLLGHERIHH